MQQNPFKVLAIILGAVIVLFAFLRIFGASEPVITMPTEYAYANGTLTLSGSVAVRCPFCTVKVWAGATEMETDENGLFRGTVPMTEDEKDSTLSITAEAFSRLWGGSGKKAEFSVTVHPQESPVELVDVPTEWKSKEITFKIKVLSGSSIDLKGGIAMVLSSEKYPFKAEWTNVPGSTDGMKLVTLRGAFGTDYDQEFEGYKLTVKANGYKTHEEKFQVNNMNYDAEKVAKDKEWSAREMKLLTMEQFDYGDAIMIAVSRNMPKSRTLGYRYVTDPNYAQFVRMRITVKNTTSEEIHVNPNYVTIMGSNGVTYNPDEATYGLSGYLDAINLQPGGSTSGWLAFILPKEEKEPTLIYSSLDGTVRKKLYVQ
ncbi:MAG: DUF4352 domain-containing protein [Candidatus Peribacteraceae bacterium]|nr:DUF4352 domain-containing protein [Candidatus Peribacteraceae bacterium]